MLIVIADDLTGAAEVAGIGQNYGMASALITEVGDNLPVSDLIVIASETRQMSEADAVAETHRICRNIKLALPRLSEARRAAMTPLQRAQAMARPDEVLHIFKKTDSALRGHVHMELRALVEESRYEQVMFLPANPSMGRTIKGGRYFINNIPIEQTDFRKDPEYPITTANVAAAIGVSPGSRLRICDAEDAGDVRRTVKMALSNRIPTMLAGGADLFQAFLEETGHKRARHKTFPGLSEKGASLIVCGSTQSHDLTQMPYITRHNCTIIPMPAEVFEGLTQGSMSIKEGTDKWMARIKQQQLVAGKSASYVLNIPYPNAGTQEAAKVLREVTAEMVERVMLGATLTELVIEGGATAGAILRRIGWSRFKILMQVAPGVVRMQSLDSSQTTITIKPGSYDWHDLFV